MKCTKLKQTSKKKKNSKLGLAVNLINLTLTYPIVTAKAASHNL